MNLSAPGGNPLSTESTQTSKWKYLGGDEAADLRSEVRKGNLTGLRKYLEKSRKDHDWQDRVFILSLVVPALRVEALNFAAELEPEAADLALLRCVWFTNRAWEMRGHGTCDEVGKVGFEAAANCIRSALEALEKANNIDPDDPTPHVYILRALIIFSALAPVFRAAFSRAQELAPSLVPAHFVMVNVLSKRWGGSHETSLEWARKAVQAAPTGTDMPVCLFWAHDLVRTHLDRFDSAPAAAEAYARRPEVRAELEEAFDRWTLSPYEPRRSSAPYLHRAAAWFYRVLDRERLQCALTLLGNTYSSGSWSEFGDPRKAYLAAARFAFDRPADQSSGSDACEECFTFAISGARSLGRGELDKAEGQLATAMRFAMEAEPEQAAVLIAMVQLHQCQLRRKQGRNDEAKQLGEQAANSLDGLTGEALPAKIHRRIAAVFQEMNDIRRAIPFWSHAIRTAPEDTKPSALADMLQNLGECYCRLGLAHHGAIPLRSALRILRQSPGDPRTLSTLLTLGNSLRKSSPAEAERLFNEAAELCTSNLQYESAASAWVNLGILCSEQERYEESLDFYQRALRIRQQTPGTPASGVGRVLNNIANCYRRMGKFAEAHRSVDQALRILAPDDPIIAFFYGTKARVFLAEGEDVQAVEWLRKTRAERNNQPSANLESTVEDLEGEIAALDRLGRVAEAAEARAALDSLRASVKQIPGSGGIQPDVSRPAEGAVFVEIASGCHTRSAEWPDELDLLARKLVVVVEKEQSGYYAGRVVVPENVTFLFHGHDAEKLFASLEPALQEHPLCAGAKVTVQQNGIPRKALIVRRDLIRLN